MGLRPLFQSISAHKFPSYFSPYWQLPPEPKLVALVPWNEESLTGVAYIFKPLIGIASKVAPPTALPFSCCTATSVSGPSSPEGRCRGGPAVTREPNWGPRMHPSATTAVLPLAERQDQNPVTSQGSEVARWLLSMQGQRAALLWWWGHIGQQCPAVCINSDRSPQLLSPSPKGKHDDKCCWCMSEV